MAGRITPASGRYGGKGADERRAERRRLFREAGLELFGAEPGYRHTRITDVCKAAGLSTRQFYEEFHTLEDLLRDLHLYVNDLARRAVVAALPETEGLPFRDRVTVLFRAYMRGATADPRFARIAYVEVIGVSARLDRQRLDRRAVWIDFLDGQRTAAVERGEVPPGDYRIAAAAFIGAVNGLMHDWVVGWVDATPDELADELLGLMLARIGLPDGPRGVAQ